MRTGFLVALAFLVSAPTLAADNFVPPLCPGTWKVSAGQTISPMGPGAAGGEGSVELRVHECGDMLVVHEFLTGIPDGISDRDFLADGGGDAGVVYRHETSARMPVVVALRKESPRRLVGEINIAGGAFTKPLELTLLDFEPSHGYGCPDKRYKPDEEGELFTEWPKSELIEALVDAMQRQGLTPPPGAGLKLGDYIHVRTARIGRKGDDTGAHRAYLRLGADGHILPREDAIGAMDGEHRACAVDSESLQGVTHWLAFKPTRHTDGTHDVAAQLIELETGVIKSQQMKSGDRGVDGLADALKEGWEALKLGDQQLTDGRVN